jgi:hypothetical protein
MHKEKEQEKKKYKLDSKQENIEKISVPGGNRK